MKIESHNPELFVKWTGARGKKMTEKVIPQNFVAKMLGVSNAYVNKLLTKSSIHTGKTKLDYIDISEEGAQPLRLIVKNEKYYEYLQSIISHE